MKFILALLVTLLLAGCGQQNVKEVLSNLSQDCTRHYAGSLSTGIPANGAVTFQIDCSPEHVTASAATSCATGSDAVNTAAKSYALYSADDKATFDFYAAQKKSDCNTSGKDPAVVAADTREAQRALAKLKVKAP